ncbi:MAG: biotin/lipoyl-containing protein, partial [Actinomycetota bacterium]
MPQIKQFRLPDVGEGLTEAEIVSWKVKPGDTIKVNDTIVEIETAKSLVELPSPFAGVVSELMVDEGQTVDVGTPIISVDVDPSGTAPMPAAAAEIVPSSPSEVETPPEEGATEPGMVGGPASGGRQSVLVGYGPRTTEAKRRPRQPVASGTPVAPATKVLAKPPVRKLAKDLGVDLASLTPSGAGGVVTRDDVLAASQPAAAPAARAGARETRVPIKGVRKMTAQAVTTSAFTAPHVTEFVAVDVTRTMRLVDRLRSDREFAGVKVSPLLVV